jgi:hypothetical protein
MRRTRVASLTQLAERKDLQHTSAVGRHVPRNAAEGISAERSANADSSAPQEDKLPSFAHLAERGSVCRQMCSVRVGIGG